MGSLRDRERVAYMAEIAEELKNAPPKQAPSEVPAEIRRKGMTLREKQEFAAHDRVLADQAAQEEAARMKPIIDAAKRIGELERQIEEEQKASIRQTIFKEPSAEISSRTKQFNVSTDLSDGVFMTDTEVFKAITSSFAIFQKALKVKGVVLTHAGIRKLYKICEQNVTADTRAPETFMQIFDYGVELGLFTEEDASGLENLRPQPAVKRVTEPERTVEQINAELDAIPDARTPADRLRVQQLRIELLGLEAKDGIWSEFVQHIRKTFDEFGYDEQKKCTTWLEQNNLLLNAVNLNRYRISRGWTTPSEELGAQIEADERSASEYSFKTDVRNRQREIAQKK